MQEFAEHLDRCLQQSGMPLRRIALLSGLPHQTLHNWLKGTRPRWYAGLSGDLHRLAAVLGLDEEAVERLLRLAGCIPAQSERLEGKEDLMRGRYQVPKGWDVAGMAPDMYEMGLDPSVLYQNKPAVTLKARPNPAAFGTLMQTFKADAYQGKRLRFSAVVRSEEIDNTANLWMRVDGPNGQMLAFDNMRDRPITGTTDWTRYAVVLDIAPDAEAVAFGIFLAGDGQVWMADVHMDEVGPDIPTTDTMADIVHPAPENLEFEA